MPLLPKSFKNLKEILRSMPSLSAKAISLLKAHGQQELILEIALLSECQIQAIEEQINHLCGSAFHSASRASMQPSTPITPFTNPSFQEDRFYSIGENAIREGKIAAILLAGGDGSRLGFKGPKGCFPIYKRPLKTLFHYHCEKILHLQKSLNTLLSLVILTSENNDQSTKEFFASHSYFGLAKEKIFFLKQPHHPLLTVQGKWFLNPQKKIATAPNGNGSLLKLFKETPVLKSFEHYFVANIDNPLPALYDPNFLGYHLHHNLDFSLKIIPKRSKNEKIGVLGLQGPQLKILDYTQLKNPSLFPFGNINFFILKKEWIQSLDPNSFALYKVLKKSHRYDVLSQKEELIDVFKEEFFITDVAEFANKWGAVLYKREEVFAPLKELKGKHGLSQLKMAVLKNSQSN